MSGIAEAIVMTIRQPILVLDRDMTVVLANRAFAECFEVSEGEAIGHAIHELGNGQWDIPQFRQLLNELVHGGGEVTNYRVEHTFETIGHRTMIMNGRHLQENEGHLLLAISDVTEQERRENELLVVRRGAEGGGETRNARKRQRVGLTDHVPFLPPREDRRRNRLLLVPHCS